MAGSSTNFSIAPVLFPALSGAVGEIPCGFGDVAAGSFKRVAELLRYSNTSIELTKHLIIQQQLFRTLLAHLGAYLEAQSVHSHLQNYREYSPLDQAISASPFCLPICPAALSLTASITLGGQSRPNSDMLSHRGTASKR